jgi:hypothetical protein
MASIKDAMRPRLCSLLGVAIELPEFVVVRRGDPAHGQLRFGSIGPFYAESVLRRVFPL